MNNIQILQTIATSSPDFVAFSEAFPPTPTVSLPPDLLDEMLAVLSENSQQAVAIEALSNASGATESFVTGGEVVTLLVIAFVLRTHIKLERTTTGKWKFLIEHKPADSKLLTTLLKKLEDWMNGSNP